MEYCAGCHRLEFARADPNLKDQHGWRPRLKPRESLMRARGMRK